VPHWRCPSSGYFKANATIARWEALLSTRFVLWARKSPGATQDRVLLAESYSVHPDVAAHVFHIFNVVDPPSTLHSKVKNRQLASNGGGTVTPSVIAKLYKQSATSGHSGHSQSVFSTSEEYFSQTDLIAFQQKHGLKVQEAVSVGAHSLSSPKTCSTPTAPTSFDCFEGNLDIQYIMGTAQDTRTIYHYVGDSNPFVAYITAVSGQADPPKVMSISWGSTEQAMSSSVMTSFCNEALALAARGVSILVSSGDNGAAGTGYSATGTCDKSTCSTDSGSSSGASSWGGKNKWSGAGYLPSFPATCPYVTAVGGTMGLESGHDEVAVQSDSCYSSGSSSGGVVTSGGGFSSFFEQPAWQEEAVNAYFNKAPAPSKGFNRYGRAIPDISALAVRYAVEVGGQSYHLYGTSASAPVLAGFVSVVNGLRAHRNMSSIGWLNKALYGAGGNTSMQLFNDITVGSNFCCSSNYCASSVCCDSGFHAAAGWDPATGWGSINFDKFATIFATSVPDYPVDSWFAWAKKMRADNLTVFIVLGACALWFLTWGCLRCTQRWKDFRRDVRANVNADHAPARALATAATAPPLPPLQDEDCPFCRQRIEDPVALVAHVQMCRQFV